MTNSVAIVTGASQGIGRSTAVRLAMRRLARSTPLSSLLQRRFRIVGSPTAYRSI